MSGGAERKQPWQKSYLFATLFSAMASSLAWAVQAGYSTPELLSLGLSRPLVGLVWLMGPFSGIIVQPLVGMLSDNSLVLFSQASRIGQHLGDTSGTVALAVAIAAFMALDCSINAMMAPTRALVADIVPEEQQDEASAYISIHDGLGKATGYLLGSVNLEREVRGIGGELQIVYSIAALVLLVYCSITFFLATDDCGPCTAARDRPASGGGLSVVWRAFAAMPHLPPAAMRVFFVQFCNTFAWFSFMVYGTDYFGNHIYGGSAQAPIGSKAIILYEEGLRTGNFALFALSISSAVFSRFLMPATSKLGLVPVYIAAELMLMVGLLLMPIIRSSAMAVALYAAFGIPFAVSNTIPWMIVTREISSSPDAGLYSATFNLSQCLPQIITSALSGPVLIHFHDNTASVFVMSAVGASLAALLIVILIDEPPHESYRELSASVAWSDQGDASERSECA
ncbi:Major facilitator superfamily (MFS) profile domain-containing protein [Plasmodiophora brassicae]